MPNLYRYISPWVGVEPNETVWKEFSTQFLAPRQAKYFSHAHFWRAHHNQFRSVVSPVFLDRPQLLSPIQSLGEPLSTEQNPPHFSLDWNPHPNSGGGPFYGLWSRFFTLPARKDRGKELESPPSICHPSDFSPMWRRPDEKSWCENTWETSVSIGTFESWFILNPWITGSLVMSSEAHRAPYLRSSSSTNGTVNPKPPYSSGRLRTVSCWEFSAIWGQFSSERRPLLGMFGAVDHNQPHCTLERMWTSGNVESLPNQKSSRLIYTSTHNLRALNACPVKRVPDKRVPDIRVPKVWKTQTKESHFLGLILIDKSLFHILTASLQIRFNYQYQLVEGSLKKIDYLKLVCNPDTSKQS